MSGKVVLAYSGGLDTSIIIPWLQENARARGALPRRRRRTGRGRARSVSRRKAAATGAASCRVDRPAARVPHRLRVAVRCARWRCTRVATCSARAMARPCWRKGQVDYAREVGATLRRARLHRQGQRSGALRARLHGAATPDLEIIAPWRDWEIKSREDALDYADERDIQVVRHASRRSTRATATSGTSATKAGRSRSLQPRDRRATSG